MVGSATSAATIEPAGPAILSAAGAALPEIDDGLKRNGLSSGQKAAVIGMAVTATGALVEVLARTLAAQDLLKRANQIADSIESSAEQAKQDAIEKVFSAEKKLTDLPSSSSDRECYSAQKGIEQAQDELRVVRQKQDAAKATAIIIKKAGQEGAKAIRGARITNWREVKRSVENTFDKQLESLSVVDLTGISTKLDQEIDLIDRRVRYGQGVNSPELERIWQKVDTAKAAVKQAEVKAKSNPTDVKLMRSLISAQRDLLTAYNEVITARQSNIRGPITHQGGEQNWQLIVDSIRIQCGLEERIGLLTQAEVDQIAQQNGGLELLQELPQETFESGVRVPRQPTINPIPQSSRGNSEDSESSSSQPVRQGEPNQTNSSADNSPRNSANSRIQYGGNAHPVNGNTALRPNPKYGQVIPANQRRPIPKTNPGDRGTGQTVRQNLHTRRPQVRTQQTQPRPQLAAQQHAPTPRPGNLQTSKLPISVITNNNTASIPASPTPQLTSKNNVIDTLSSPKVQAVAGATVAALTTITVAAVEEYRRVMNAGGSPEEAMSAALKAAGTTAPFAVGGAALTALSILALNKYRPPITAVGGTVRAGIIGVGVGVGIAGIEEAIDRSSNGHSGDKNDRSWRRWLTTGFGSVTAAIGGALGFVSPVPGGSVAGGVGGYKVGKEGGSWIADKVISKNPGPAEAMKQALVPRNQSEQTMLEFCEWVNAHRDIASDGAKRQADNWKHRYQEDRLPQVIEAVIKASGEKIDSNT